MTVKYTNKSLKLSSIYDTETGWYYTNVFISDSDGYGCESFFEDNDFIFSNCIVMYPIIVRGDVVYENCVLDFRISFLVNRMKKSKESVKDFVHEFVNCVCRKTGEVINEKVHYTNVGNNIFKNDVVFIDPSVAPMIHSNEKSDKILLVDQTVKIYNSLVFGVHAIPCRLFLDGCIIFSIPSKNLYGRQIIIESVNSIKIENGSEKKQFDGCFTYF